MIANTMSTNPVAPPPVLRARQALGKYRIEKRLGEGGFAVVYQAMDTIEGIRVALKIPRPQYVTQKILEDFRQEVKVTARLTHPNVLQIKNADMIDGHFVIALPVGIESLDDRLKRRLALPTILDFSEQMLAALAYAHSEKIIHCDVKPENLVLFEDHCLRLSDFGLAKVALKTLRASGSGTVGYLAPEQAMGQPSFRSDVFSAGLIMYRMLSGVLPEWPFRWPGPGYQRLKRRAHPELMQLIRRSIEVLPRKRYRDAVNMLNAFQRIKKRALEFGGY